MVENYDHVRPERETIHVRSRVLFSFYFDVSSFFILYVAIWKSFWCTFLLVNFPVYHFLLLLFKWEKNMSNFQYKKKWINKLKKLVQFHKKIPTNHLQNVGKPNKLNRFFFCFSHDFVFISASFLICFFFLIE